VVDMERHWQTIWADRDPEAVSWFQRSADVSLRSVIQTTPDLAAPVVDVGGGAAPLAGQLVEHGYRDVTVLDVSEAAVRAGRQRLGAAAEQVRWIVADVTRHGFDRDYAFWHDRAVLHFLTDAADAVRYVDQLIRAVRPGGHAVIATFGPEGPASCSGLTVRRYDPARLAGLVAGNFDAVGFEHELHRTPDGTAQQFLYGVFRRVS
jgi:SAM-dependent methyltransferase